MFCGDPSLVKLKQDGIHVIPLKCRAWTCEDCQPTRKRQLQQLAWRGRPNKFITLTTNTEAFDDAETAARCLIEAWRFIRKKLESIGHFFDGDGSKGSFGKVEFLAVFEETPSNGYPHLHIIARCGYIPQEWLSRVMQNFMASPIVDIRKVRSSKQIANYVTKYIGKAPGKFGTCKRYWASRAWQQGKKDRKTDELTPVEPSQVVFKHCTDLVLLFKQAYPWTVDWTWQGAVLGFGRDPPTDPEQRAIFFKLLKGIDNPKAWT